MRAAVLDSFGAPLALQQVADPVPGPGEVVVRVRAAGICATDLKIIDGKFPMVVPPRIIGHEPAGEVVALGPGVREAREGDRAAVAIDVRCGLCAYCRVDSSGHYCTRLQRVGFERDGGLAEFLVVPEANLVPLGEEVSFEAGATLPDAIGTSYHAVVTRARVQPSEVVVVNGLGGLGLVAVQVAALAGARVVGVARNAGRRAEALALGASEALDPGDGDLSERIRDLTGGLGVHVFLDFVGTEESLQQAVRSLRKGGRIVVVGYVSPDFTTSIMQVMLGEVTIMGSRGSTRADLHAAADLLRRGRIRPVIGLELGLDEVNHGLDLLREGAVTGRIVVRP